MLFVLTFFISRLICLLSRHQDSIAAGFEPELTHSMSYDLSAEMNLSLVIMCTAAGFTVRRYRLVNGLLGTISAAEDTHKQALTIDVQYHDFVGGRRQVRVAGHAHQPGVDVLPSDARIRQMVDGLAVGSMLERLIDHRIVQIPRDVRTRFACGWLLLLCALVAN